MHTRTHTQTQGSLFRWVSEFMLRMQQGVLVCMDWPALFSSCLCCAHACVLKCNMGSLQSCGVVEVTQCEELNGMPWWKNMECVCVCTRRRQDFLGGQRRKGIACEQSLYMEACGCMWQLFGDSGAAETDLSTHTHTQSEDQVTQYVWSFEMRGFILDPLHNTMTCPSGWAPDSQRCAGLEHYQGISCQDHDNIEAWSYHLIHAFDHTSADTHRHSSLA